MPRVYFVAAESADEAERKFSLEIHQPEIHEDRRKAQEDADAAREGGYETDVYVIPIEARKVS